MKSAVLERLGPPGTIGIGVLLFCLAFHVGNVAPLLAERAALADAAAQLAAAAGQRGSAAPANASPLPPLTDAPALLKRLNALTEKHGSVIERVTYQLKGTGSVLRLEVRLPLKMTYPALRAFLREALALSAVASLDEAALHRDHAGDLAVEARLRLSYAFVATP